MILSLLLILKLNYLTMVIQMMNPPATVEFHKELRYPYSRPKRSNTMKRSIKNTK